MCYWMEFIGICVAQLIPIIGIPLLISGEISQKKYKTRSLSSTKQLAGIEASASKKTIKFFRAISKKADQQADSLLPKPPKKMSK